jgi:hypothetical protein
VGVPYYFSPCPTTHPPPVQFTLILYALIHTDPSPNKRGARGMDRAGFELASYAVCRICVTDDTTGPNMSSSVFYDRSITTHDVSRV